MNILYVHNEYGKYSGEEAVFYAQVEACRKFSNVYTYVESANYTPKSIADKSLAFFSGIFSIKSFFNIFRLVKKRKIDIVHFHNIYPWISVSGVLAAKIAGAKVIFTLHNFKHICPSSTLTHRGQKYFRTLDKGAFNTVTDNVQGNYFKSLGYYLRFKSEQLFRLRMLVDKFFIVSDLQCSIYERYAKDVAIKASIIPNFLRNEAELKTHYKVAEKSVFKRVLFIGRPTEEKGFNLYHELSLRMQGYEFSVIGNDKLERPKDNISYKGRLFGDELYQEVVKHDVLIVPSLTFETFSLVALEALTLGLTVIVTNNVGISSYCGEIESLYACNSDIESLVFLLNSIGSQDPSNKPPVRIPLGLTEAGFRNSVEKEFKSLLN